MSLLALEHSKTAYRADFGIYGLAVIALAVFLVWTSSPAEQVRMLGWALLGFVAWSPIEYGLHRFVLHGMQPFRRWHQQHHGRPRALICMPTVLSAGLIGSLVWLPAWLWLGKWFASALTLGVLAGYWMYAITHHATHHWRARSQWLKRRNTWHGLHHHSANGKGRFGVTGEFWDQQLGTASERMPRVLRQWQCLRLVVTALLIAISTWLVANLTNGAIAAWYLLVALLIARLALSQWRKRFWSRRSYQMVAIETLRHSAFTLPRVRTSQE